jgi:hypothetical protein
MTFRHGLHGYCWSAEYRLRRYGIPLTGRLMVDPVMGASTAVSSARVEKAIGGGSTTVVVSLLDVTVYVSSYGVVRSISNASSQLVLRAAIFVVDKL